MIYTPNDNYFGKDQFSYTITDSGGLTSSALVLVNVTPVNDPPTANSNTYTLDLLTGTTLTAQARGVPGNDIDVDGDILRAVRDFVDSNGNGVADVGLHMSFGGKR